MSGIVSFGGENCADKEIPGAYTTVSYFSNWIFNTVNELNRVGAPNVPPAYYVPQQNRQQTPWYQHRNSLAPTTPGADEALLAILADLLTSVGDYGIRETTNHSASLP